MSEWKELKIDNLPSDILTGDYEFTCGFSVENLDGLSDNSLEKRMKYLRFMVDIFHGENYIPYWYRKAQPKAPTHKEIMKPRFWQMDNPDFWRSITGVKNINGKTLYLMYDGWCDSSFFTGRESADIPPES